MQEGNRIKKQLMQYIAQYKVNPSTIYGQPHCHDNKFIVSKENNMMMTMGVAHLYSNNTGLSLLQILLYQLKMLKL